MDLYIKMLLSIFRGLGLVFVCLVLKATPSEVFNNLDEQEISSVAYRLQDEKQQRLLIQNDVEVMMLKIGVLERSLGELKQSQMRPDKCPGDDWKKHGDSCYYFGQELLSWQEAAIQCGRLGAHLADIISAAENEFVTEEAKKIGGYHWVAGTDIFSDGDWIWMTRMQLIGGLAFWSDGQPDNAGRSEHCLEINWGSDAGWNDRPCGFKEKYICEIEV